MKREHLTIFDVPVVPRDDSLPFQTYSRMLGADMFLHASMTKEKGQPVLGLSHLPAFQPIDRMRPLAVMAENPPEGHYRAIRIVQPSGRKPVRFDRGVFKPLHELLKPYAIVVEPNIFLARANGDIGRVTINHPEKPLHIRSQGITEELGFRGVPAHTVVLAAVRAVAQFAAARSWA